jgi:hypothetical protein
MGNCCGTTTEQGNVTLMKGGNKFQASEFFDDRTVAGYKGVDKIILLIKIQALFRGAVARKKIKQRYGFQVKTMGGRGAMVDTNY